MFFSKGTEWDSVTLFLFDSTETGTLYCLIQKVCIM